VGLQLADRPADERAAAQRLEPDQPHLARREIDDLQRPRVADQSLDVLRDRLLGAQVHVHGEPVRRAIRGCDRGGLGRRRVGRHEQAAVTRVIAGADPRDLGPGAEQAPGDVTRHHVGLVAVGQRDDHVGITRAGRFERARTRGVALHGADVDAVLQVAQQRFVEVDDGDVVGFFPGEVVRGRATDLPGPENDDFQVSWAIWGCAPPF
jgi:hypothetical protein